MMMENTNVFKSGLERAGDFKNWLNFGLLNYYNYLYSPEVFRLEGVSDTVSGGHELIFSVESKTHSASWIMLGFQRSLIAIKTCQSQWWFCSLVGHS